MCYVSIASSYEANVNHTNSLQLNLCKSVARSVYGELFFFSSHKRRLPSKSFLLLHVVSSQCCVFISTDWTVLVKWGDEFLKCVVFVSQLNRTIVFGWTLPVLHIIYCNTQKQECFLFLMNWNGSRWVLLFHFQLFAWAFSCLNCLYFVVLMWSLKFEFHSVWTCVGLRSQNDCSSLQCSYSIPSCPCSAVWSLCSAVALTRGRVGLKMPFAALAGGSLRLSLLACTALLSHSLSLSLSMYLCISRLLCTAFFTTCCDDSPSWIFLFA